MTMPLDIKAEVSKLQKMYKEDPRQHTFNILITGEMGSGKTFIGRTARFPVHIDSFDPGGSKCLQPWIDKGDIIVDSSYESENPMKPFAFKEWKVNFRERVASGYFEQFGTYMLDSSTTWSESIMNWILQAVGIAGQAPRWAKDYIPQKMEIRNYIRKMLDLPCDFIATGHLELHTDPDGGMKLRFMTTGKGAVLIPILFDEVYVTLTKGRSDGVTYNLLTKPTNEYLARSRLAKDGLLEILEKPDIKHLLKKAGLSINDKPKL